MNHLTSGFWRLPVRAPALRVFGRSSAPVFLAVAALTCAPVYAQRIGTVTASTNMGSGFGTNIQNTVNGNGLSALTLTASHAATVPSNSWVSSGPLTGNVTFNLGGSFLINSFSFWNQNGGGPGANGSTGINSVQVQISTDGVTFTPLVGGPTQFAQVPGASNLPPQIFSFPAVRASYIRFNILSNYGDIFETGLAEVGFNATTGLGCPPTGLCVTNYTLVSQQIAASNRVYATYRADLVNTIAPPVPVVPPGTSQVTATLINLDPFKVRAVPGQDQLKFAAVLTANSVTPSSNTFTVIVDPATFDPNQLQWSFQIGPAAPVANPGPNQTVAVGSTVTVNGSGSSNSGGAGGPLTYFWMFTSRPPGTMTRLLYETSPVVMFVADVPGTYVLQLTVSNGVSSSTASVTITAQ